MYSAYPQPTAAPQRTGKGKGYIDVEDQRLYPEITTTDNGLRLGFIQKVRAVWPSSGARRHGWRFARLSSLRPPLSSLLSPSPLRSSHHALQLQVYGILCAQLCLTALVCSLISALLCGLLPLVRLTLCPPVFDKNVALFVFAHPAVQILAMVLPLLLLLPLYAFRQSHPLNLILLGGWTATMSVGVGIACSLYPSAVVLQALILTSAITLGLMSYTFYAVRRGQEFDFMAPMIFASLFGLVGFSLLALFVPIGTGAQLVLAGLGSLLFAAYIVYDTFLLIKRFSLDDYVWASLSLYLDILNLFLRLLEILGMANRD